MVSTFSIALPLAMSPLGNGSCSTVLITNQLREILVYHDKILQYLVTDIVAIYPKVLWRIQGMVQIVTGVRPEDCK